ncbi:phosphonate transport system ATP-binding protein [Leucobacter luti]|uniref:Phosphonate transport system ATP-binding protein n=1 Tax=Leucobacter luti TaxID=340320 RepID=A0A4R6RTY0_9MICO|nr:phosphonate ABC transporter ATP-binding protein [Leucobacter luti]TDP90224.1 phosphonate transport system ATP-binding protein [Leucobacter luti]
MEATTHPAELAVDLRNITKSFDGSAVPALAGIDLAVPYRQRLVLLGLSGSGKSTTLRLLNRLHDPSTGDLTVLGTDPLAMRGRQLRQFRQRVAFVFQHFNLVGRLSAIENVLAGGLGTLRGPRSGLLMYPNRMRLAALEQLDRVGLADYAFQRAGTLSGGQQQRVGIARALFQQPELLLADEPVASLDPESSRQVLDILQQVSEEDGLTVICSLHQVEVAIDWADRIVGLRGGQIVFDRDAGDVQPDDVALIYRAEESKAHTPEAPE